jgi:NAD(P) transhydrogenase subunit alpha
MLIGISKETAPNECRVAGIPDTIAKMVKTGLMVAIEAEACLTSYIEERIVNIKKAGANIRVPGVERLFGEPDIILKVQKPFLNDKVKKHEADMMKQRAVMLY